MDRIKEWVTLIGRRNIAYVFFVSLMVPFGMLIEAAGPQGPDSGGGIMAAIMLWSVVSLIFFIANAGLAVGFIARGRSATRLDEYWWRGLRGGRSEAVSGRGFSNAISIYLALRGVSKFLIRSG